MLLRVTPADIGQLTHIDAASAFPWPTVPWAGLRGQHLADPGLSRRKGTIRASRDTAPGRAGRQLTTARAAATARAVAAAASGKPVAAAAPGKPAVSRRVRAGASPGRWAVVAVVALVADEGFRVR
jgi:hypothetical protein